MLKFIDLYILFFGKNSQRNDQKRNSNFILSYILRYINSFNNLKTRLILERKNIYIYSTQTERRGARRVQMFAIPVTYYVTDYLSFCSLICIVNKTSMGSTRFYRNVRSTDPWMYHVYAIVFCERGMCAYTNTRTQSNTRTSSVCYMYTRICTQWCTIEVPMVGTCQPSQWIRPSALLLIEKSKSQGAGRLPDSNSLRQSVIRFKFVREEWRCNCIPCVLDVITHLYRFVEFSVVEKIKACFVTENFPSVYYCVLRPS